MEVKSYEKSLKKLFKGEEEIYPLIDFARFLVNFPLETPLYGKNHTEEIYIYKD